MFQARRTGEWVSIGSIFDPDAMQAAITAFRVYAQGKNEHVVFNRIEGGKVKSSFGDRLVTYEITFHADYSPAKIVEQNNYCCYRLSLHCSARVHKNWIPEIKVEKVHCNEVSYKIPSPM